MAANMDALLRITARTAGTDSIEQLTKKLTGSEQAATRLTQTTKLMGAAFSAVGAADLARRMGDYAKSTLEAGEQSGLVGMRIKNLAGQFNETAAVTKLAADSAKRYGLSQLEAAGGVADLYGRLRPLGIGLADIQSTFTGVNNAAKAAGLSTYDAKEAFLQLGQAMGSGRLQGDELRSLMERMPAIGRAIVDVFNETARSTKVTVGDLKQLGADGVITTDIIVMAMKKLEQIQPPPPTAMQQFTAAMADLRMELGENLLPLLTPGIQLLTGLLRAFNGLPEPIKAVAGSLLVLAGALAAIALPLAGFVGSIKMLAGIGLWTTITGAFTGFLTFMGTTFVPALLAFFSGPAGWITLAVIAVGGMVYAFREPIGNFISWMGEQLGGLGKSIGGWLAEVAKTIYGAVDTIKSAIQAGIKFTWDYVSGAVGSVAESLARPFTTAAETIKGVLRMVLQFSANIINGFLGAVNQAISAVNNVASRVNLPQLPTFSPVSAPSFEGGGYTGNAPRIGGLDGRGGFPAILHPQETIIDHARPGRQSSTPAAINIPVTTGQVIQMPDGTDYVSMSDFQAGMQAVAEGIMAQLFTPAGRMALGGAR